MTVATTLVNRPILVSQLQFRGLNRFSIFKLDICGKFKFKKSISHCTLNPPKMVDSVENRAAAAVGDEGVSFGDLEQEALIDGSMNFSSDGVKAILNSLFQRVVAALQNASFEKRDMARDSCLARVTVGVVVGGEVGGVVGAGTYEAVCFKVSRLLKNRYIGQTTLRRATIFGFFLGAGSLIHCGKSY